MYDDHWQRGELVENLQGIFRLPKRNKSEIAEVSEETLGSFAAAETPEEAKEVELVTVFWWEFGVMFTTKTHDKYIIEVSMWMI